MKRGIWLVGAMSAVMVVVLVGFSSSSSARSAPKTYPVTSTTVVFTDHSRSTPAAGTAPLLPYRTLPTLIVHPTRASSKKAAFPLLVFSHGYSDTAANELPTLKAMASHGYVVAAVDFPLTTGTANDDLFDFPNQPGDVNFVITKMLDLNTTERSVVHQQIESKEIGIFGHSLGAVTTMAVGYNSCCKDARVSAVAELDGQPTIPELGAQGNFPGAYFKGHRTPLLAINGTADTINPYSAAQSTYAAASAPKFLLSLIGAPHTGVFEEPWSPVTNEALLQFFNRYLKQSATVAQIEQAGTKSGVATIQVDAR